MKLLASHRLASGYNGHAFISRATGLSPDPCHLTPEKLQWSRIHLKGYWHTGRRPPFYYYRDKDLREIDLLLVQDGVAYPLEIKKTASPGRDAVRHFGALERLGLPVGPGGLICLAEQVLPLTATAQSIPAWTI